MGTNRNRKGRIAVAWMAALFMVLAVSFSLQAKNTNIVHSTSGKPKTETKKTDTKPAKKVTGKNTGHKVTVTTHHVKKGKPISTSGAVDLGLSVRWAAYNVGASSPEEYGGYYGWADPTGTKTSTNLSDYPSANPPSNISGTSYDIARAKWGGNWRLPTKAEQQELVDKCTWTWTTYKGVEGMKVTGPNGNSIFLPAAGGRGGTDVGSVGTYGNYWSGTLNECSANFAYNLGFGNNGYLYVGIYYRINGFTVRPVVE
jgi:hypothetical protein